MTYLFIDGYNIIGAWPELICLREDHLEEARDKLISILMDFAAVSEMDVVLVFDGWRVKGGQEVQIENPYLDIYYTKEGVTADMLIERLVASLPKHQTVYVATSDRLEQETILAFGGLRISALELRDMINGAKRSSRPHMQAKTHRHNPLDARLDEKTRQALQAMMEQGKD